MRQYKSYMDHVKVSGDLHRRLAELEGPGKRPVPWVKYASLAAALALVCGLGVWGLGKVPGGPGQLAACFMPTVAPELGGLDEPDIALEEPGDAAQPGMRTLGGYEVAEDGAAAYYVLPYIEYGETGGMGIDLDWDVPPGAVKRDLTREDVAALLGGEDVLSTHLDWDGYELSGWAAWYEDGSFWGAYIDGLIPNYGSVVDQFQFAVTAGQLPPTCIAYPGSVEQNISGVIVTADQADWENRFGEETANIHDRRVSFMTNGYGYRFEVSFGDPEAAEKMVSRLVRQMADQGVDALEWDGSYTCRDCGETVPAGVKHNHPFTGVGEPNWDGSGEGWICPGCGAYIEAGVEHDHTQDGSPRDRGENWCGTPGADTEAYPSDSFLTCRTCGGGVPDKTQHHCKPDGSGGHVCGLCGEAFPEGKVHSHEVCGLPLAPETWTCEACGETVQHGMAHDCTMCSGYPAPHICEMCGEAYPEGTAHACRQEGHHQGSHH